MTINAIAFHLKKLGVCVCVCVTEIIINKARIQVQIILCKVYLLFYHTKKILWENLKKIIYSRYQDALVFVYLSIVSYIVH